MEIDKKEFNPYDVEGTIAQLNEINATDIYELFKNYYNKEIIDKRDEIKLNYFELIKKIIYGIGSFRFFLLDSPLEAEFYSIEGFIAPGDREREDFFISKLIAYFLTKENDELRFKVWTNTGLPYFGGYYEEKFAMTVKLFADYYSDNFSALSNEGKNYFNNVAKTILTLINGTEILTEILNKKIEKLGNISSEEIYDILRIINLLDELNKEKLKQKLFKRLFQIAIELDWINHEKESFKSLSTLLYTVKKEYAFKDIASNLNRINKKIPDDIKFELWKDYKYFKPNKEFFLKHFEKLDYQDYLIAHPDAQAEYVNSQFKKLRNLSSIQEFAQLTFLLVETPVKIPIEIFSKLNLHSKAAYWLVFPYMDNFNRKFINPTGIDFNCNDFMSYLGTIDSLSKLILMTELTSKIQKHHYLWKDDGFFKLDIKNRKRLGKEFFDNIKITNQKKLDILVYALQRCTKMDCLSVIKTLIPKFLGEDIIDRRILDIVKNINASKKIKQEIFEYVSNHVTKMVRVELWFDGCLPNIKYNEVVDVFAEFGSPQPLLLKKLFSMVQKGQIDSIDVFLARISALADNQKIDISIRNYLIDLKKIYKLKQGKKDILKEVHDYVNAYFNRIRIEKEESEQELDREFYERGKYRRYAGTYAQEVEGLSDEFIDDGLDGDPDAYWNID